MVETKLLPPAAGAEGETAALQGQIIEASTLDNNKVAKAVEKDEVVESKNKKDAGLNNYFVGSALVWVHRY
jgi:hypothetical protein